MTESTLASGGLARLATLGQTWTLALRFTAIAAQLALLLIVFWLFRLEEPAFLVLAVTMFSGFLVSFWLPLAWKEPFFVALCVGGAFLLAEPLVVTGVLALLLTIYAVSRLRTSYAVRAGLIGALLIGLTLSRQVMPPGLPLSFWPTIGAIFMFRLIIFLYDLRNMKEGPPFIAFAAYFLMLPNFYFLFFPVVDYQTMRTNFARRDLGDIAQSGVNWIVRGTIQLLLYRVIAGMKTQLPLGAVDSLPLLIKAMLLTYLLYLHVSGTFHIIVGMLRLFGYDLPETHRKYLLASSITDFWRRINIYWKDFMMKVVYLPVFFRLRKSGAVRAQVVGTSCVFVVTWALHAYQYYWLTGKMLLLVTDIAFWAILGTWVVINLLQDIRAKERGAVKAPSQARRVLNTAATFAMITVLWSLWNSPTMNRFVDLVTYWKAG